MNLQFNNEGSNLIAMVGNNTIKIINHSISENGSGEYEVSFEVEQLAEPSSENSVTFEGYNFEEEDLSNYEVTITEGGTTVPTNNPVGSIKRPETL